MLGTLTHKCARQVGDRTFEKGPQRHRGARRGYRWRPSRGQAHLVCGGPGCGKTLLAATFLVRGAMDHGEPGVFMSFDERIPDLGVNVASLGFDLPDLETRKLLATDYVHLDRQEMHETGEYDLEGLFVRLNLAVTTHRRAARRPRQHRLAVCRHPERSRAPLRAAAAVRLAQGPQAHHRDHGGARRRQPHAPWHRGVCVGLRDPARSSRHRRPVDPAPAGRQVSRHGAWHERVSVPDRRGRDYRSAHHLARPGTHGV